MSDVTRRYNKLRFLFFWLGIFLTFLPLIIFGFKGCMDGTIALENKLTFSLCFVSAITLTMLGVKSKYNCRSVTYLLLFGCYFVVKEIEIVVAVCGVCCIADEFAIRPLHRHYREKAIINKEIDKRIEG